MELHPTCLDPRALEVGEHEVPRGSELVIAFDDEDRLESASQSRYAQVKFLCYLLCAWQFLFHLSFPLPLPVHHAG